MSYILPKLFTFRLFLFLNKADCRIADLLNNKRNKTLTDESRKR
jgi:hypothetical protein